MSARLLTGDALTILRTLPDASAQTCITSPPYFALRDYGVEGQIGLEPTPAEYIATLVAVFREVRRVLRDDGTLWLNVGDSYASHDPGGYRAGEFLNPNGRPPVKQGVARNRAGIYRSGGLKPKDLIGIPWMLAFALRDDGWWLRSDIIWAKPNPMPESVTDRPTRAHEYLFLLTKSARYYYDATAIREPQSQGTHERFGKNPVPSGKRKLAAAGNGIKNNTSFDAAMRVMIQPDSQRNKRSVWTVATHPYPEAHFATYPPALIEPCILAGTSERGACPTCGAPYQRVVETTYTNPGNRTTNGPRSAGADGAAYARFDVRLEKHVDMRGWLPGCTCDAGSPVPCTVLDPFAGSGTTGVVALRHGRSFVGIDLNPEYIELARRRIYGDAPLLNLVEVT